MFDKPWLSPALGLEDARAVLALAETRHFGRAAARLGVSQPALTARLRRLEEALGARLFDRGRGAVAPTAAGLALVEGARRLVDAAQDAWADARGEAAGAGRVLRLGLTQVAAHAVAVPTLRRYRAEAPLGRVRLFEGTTAALERMLEGREIDAALLHPPLHASGLSERPLLDVPGALVQLGPPGSPDALVRYPREEAPVVMGRLATSAEAPPLGEADTILGALVLSEAGFGAAAVPDGFPHPALGGGVGHALPGRLATSVAWRALDRGEAVRRLVRAATEAVRAPGAP